MGGNQTITVQNGIFRVSLGTANPLPASIDFTTGNYYIGLRIGTDSEIVPRKHLGAVPRAISAGTAQTAVTAQSAQTLDGRSVGTNEGDLVILGNGGKIEIDQLPTGDGDDELVLGNDDRLGLAHEQNTDTGTDSEIFTIGNGTGVNSTFDLAVSSANNPPALRYNGATGSWQFSNDGSTFSDISTGSVDFLETADGAGVTSSYSGFELAGPDGDQLALLQGCTNGQGLAWNDASNIWNARAFQQDSLVRVRLGM
ncbi:MAG: hypothetical protein WDN67_03290 [Candidatus Moraniibacteriota bacterium]